MITREDLEKDFAKKYLEEIYGDRLPSFIDPVKNLRKVVSGLTKDEKKFWYGTRFYRNQSLKSRVKGAMRVWLRGSGILAGQCPFVFSGFTWEKFKSHIESQFEPWMNWSNWGEWHVDHSIPRSLYLKPYTKEEVFGLKNLKPLKASDNIRKGNKTLNV